MIHYLKIETTENKGNGVFAAIPIPAGSLVLQFQGQLVRFNEIEPGRDEWYLQVDNDLYLSPSCGIDDYVNHSCDPNCVIQIKNNIATLWAIKDIPEGTEITFDYSTDCTEVGWALNCLCGSGNCRKIVGSFSCLPLSTQEYYKNINGVPEFVIKGG